MIPSDDRAYHEVLTSEACSDCNIKQNSPKSVDKKSKYKNKSEKFIGLSKEELIKSDSDPFWIKTRWILFFLFWAVWLSLVLIIVYLILYSPKCGSIKNGERNMVIYQLCPRSFMDSNSDGLGDLKGIISKITYLKEMKINSVVITSIFQSYPKYVDDAGYNFKSISPELGSFKDFENLIKELSNNQIDVILELPILGTSYKHPWFLKSEKQRKKYENYYIWRNFAKNSLKEDLTWGISGFSSDDIFSKHSYFYSLNSKIPDLNLTNEHLLRDIDDIYDFWISKGISGFLIPNADLLFSQNKFYDKRRLLHDFFRRMRKKLGERKIFVSLFNDAFRDDDLLSGDIDVMFTKALSLISPNCNGNCVAHLINSTLNSLRVDTSEKIGWMLANRDSPSRIASKFSGNYITSLNALMLLKGPWMIFYGDELGLENDNDRKNHFFCASLPNLMLNKNCSDIVRSKMPWKFIGKKVSNLQTSYSSLLENFKQISRLRVLDPKVAGFMQIIDSHPSFLVFTRQCPGDIMHVVIINFAKENVTFVRPNSLLDLSYHLVFKNFLELKIVPQSINHADENIVDLNAAFNMPPGGVVVIRYEP